MSKFRDRLGGTALYQVARLTSAVGRFQLDGEDHLTTAVSAQKPIVFAAWHGMTMMLVGFFRTRLDLSRIVLILPDDWRGAALVIFAKKLGAHPFPMNLEGDASMAAARRLAQLVKQVKAGQYCYLTPDGPFGPAYAIKPGLTYIAPKIRRHHSARWCLYSTQLPTQSLGSLYDSLSLQPYFGGSRRTHCCGEKGRFNGR